MDIEFQQLLASHLHFLSLLICPISPLPSIPSCLSVSPLVLLRLSSLLSVLLFIKLYLFLCANSSLSLLPCLSFSLFCPFVENCQNVKSLE